MNKVVLYNISLEDDNRKKACVVDLRELKEFNPSSVVAGRRDHRSIVRIDRNHFRRFLQNAVELLGFGVKLKF